MNSSNLFRHKRSLNVRISVSIACFLLLAAYIHFVSLKAPYTGIWLKPLAGDQWLVASVDDRGKAVDWNVEPGDRIVSFGGKQPTLRTIDGETLLKKAPPFVVEKQDGRQSQIVPATSQSDIVQMIFSLLMEATLLGIGLYAVRVKPESRVIRLFYALSMSLALCILTIFSAEKTFSEIMNSLCAIWLPYLFLAFYLLFVFRTIHARFRKLLQAVRTYSIAFSGVLGYVIAIGETPKWVVDLLNLTIVGTLLLLAGITLAFWKSFDRLEQNQLIVFFAGLFLSLFPYVFLYALPLFVSGSYIVPEKYTFIGLIPFSWTITYLLVDRSMLDVRLYIPRLLIHSLYLGGVFVVLILAENGLSPLWICLVFALLVLWTYVYQKSLTRFPRKTEQRAERLEQQKLRLSIQLAEQKNIRDLLKLVAEVTESALALDGVCLICFADRQPLVYGSGKFARNEHELAHLSVNKEALQRRFDFSRIAELAPEPHGEPLGLLCLGRKRKTELFSPEDDLLIGKLQREAIQMLAGAKLLASLQKEYSRTSVESHVYGGQTVDRRRYSQMLLEAQESERIRTSYYLHDHLLQNLIFLSRDLEELYESGTADKELVAVWLKCVYDSQRDIRVLCDELYPHIIDKGDLKEALQWLLRTMREKTDMQMELHYELTAGEPTHELIKSNLFRAIRELVHNVCKHADASEMRIHVWGDGQAVYCKVSDNGKGFDVTSVFASASAGERRFGLLSVDSQLRYLGGDTAIHSSPGRGTTVTIALPLAKEAHTHVHS